MFNQITIIGNVGSDPESGVTKNGTAFYKFSVAVNKRFKDADGNQAEKTTWFRVTAWRGLAETFTSFDMLSKGKQVFVIGELSPSEYVDKAGEKQFSLEITADQIKVLGKRDDNGSVPAQTPARNGSGSKSQGSAAPTSPDDIPF